MEDTVRGRKQQGTIHNNQVTLEPKQAMKILLHLFLILLPVLVAIRVSAQNEATAAPYKTAIFVDNRAGAALNDKVAVLEDFLTSRITEKGFSFISSEITIKAVNSYPAVGFAVDTKDPLNFNVQDRGTTAKGEGSKSTEGQVSLRPGPTRLDRILNDSTSALRLAQNMGADCVLVASIATYGTEKKTFQDGDVKTVNLIHTLRVSYKLLEGTQGGSAIGDTLKASKTTRSTENIQTESSEILNELLEEASIQVAESVGKKRESIRKFPTAPMLVSISVSCGMQDLVNLPASVPDIRVLPNGTLQVETNRLGIYVLDASVELDGFGIGSAPNSFKVRPGLSKMRITRAGFNSWEQSVNFTEGQKFHVALQMSEAGYARWKDNTTFLFGLKTGEKLTDATVKVMEGFAQTLRQSGYRIDVKADAKGKSLFDGLTIQPSLFK